jgi:hypothetical protein
MGVLNVVGRETARADEPEPRRGEIAVGVGKRQL